MDVVESLVQRNALYAEQDHQPGLRMLPSLRTVVIGCVDPRVDPSALLGGAPGELVVLRNVGGRVTEDVLLQLDVLCGVTQSAGGDIADGWSVIVLQHTECGIARVADRVDLLGPFFGVDEVGLADKDVDRPREATVADVRALRAHPGLADGVRVFGMVFDVGDGRVEVVA